MENLEFLKEPVFWVLTTVGSIILSIIANLVTPKVQKFLAKNSQQKKEALEAQSRETLRKVLKIQLSNTYRTSWQIDAVLECIKGVGIILLFLAFSRVFAIFPIYELRLIVYPVLAVGAIYGYKHIQSGLTNAALTKLADERQSVLEAAEHGNTDDEIQEIVRKWDTENFGVTVEL
ncbi:hypothetical protein [Vibrio splendidus]|uniref:hypothetical protein n=1 Tax=Vibrio splendidus TaxID=29497 RepID=UPI000D34B743|nr:hypothetical protein [Vibrio splendidus]PTP76390.1 hypothetical protein CWO00_12550 [Vibrio splendidus]